MLRGKSTGTDGWSLEIDEFNRKLFLSLIIEFDPEWNSESSSLGYSSKDETPEHHRDEFNQAERYCVGCGSGMNFTVKDYSGVAGNMVSHSEGTTELQWNEIGINSSRQKFTTHLRI